MRISDWSSDVCSSDLSQRQPQVARPCRLRLFDGIIMSRFSAVIALGAAQVRCPPNESRVRFRYTATALCGLLLTPCALADEHAHPEAQIEELSPTVITAVAPSSPLTVVTNPKDPRDRKSTRLKSR